MTGGRNGGGSRPAVRGSRAGARERVRWLARAATLAAWAMASRLLGLVRDLAMAWLLGAGGACEALVAALLLPHALRKLLADGVLPLPFTAAVAAAGVHAGGREAGSFRLLSRPVLGGVAPLAAAVGLAVLAVFLCGASPLAALLSPGGYDPAWAEQAALLVLMAAPYLALTLPCGLVMGLLHARGAYGTASAAAVIFNVVMLMAIALAALGLAGPAPLMAAGFSLGGVAQLAWLTVSLRRAEAGLPAPAPGARAARAAALRLRRGLARLPGVVLASSSLPMALLAAMVPASMAGEGSMAALYFADRLLELPIGIVGSCTGVAALPGLSSSAARHDGAAFAQRLSFTLRVGLLFSLPAMAGLFAIAPCLTAVLLGHGAFSEAGAASTAMVLRCLAPALPAAVALRALVAACHAAGADRLAWGGSLLACLATLLAGLVLRAALPAAWVGMAAPLAVSVALWAQCLLLLAWAARHGRGAVPGAGDGTRLAFCGLAAGAAAGALLAVTGNGVAALLSACVLGALAWLAAVRAALPGDFRLLLSLRRHGGASAD